MDNTIFYLAGPSGVGKYTVGRALAALTGARLIDNHTWCNVIFGLIEIDGRTPLPDDIWDRTAEVRRAVLATLSTHAPGADSFVFTHAAVGAGDPVDRRIVADFAEVAKARTARLVAVRLTCAPEVLARRVVSPGRGERFKTTDQEAARRDAVEPPFDPGFGSVSGPAFTIDTTDLPPEDTAKRIVDLVSAGDRSTQSTGGGPPC